MKILHLSCLNNDPEIQPNMGPKCNPVGGEPHTVIDDLLFSVLEYLLRRISFTIPIFVNASYLSSKQLNFKKATVDLRYKILLLFYI